VNNAVGTGGAINCRLVSAISTCLFENNVANSGGAIFSSNPSFQVADCTFQSNATLENGGGGAIMIQSSGSPTFVRCSFIENEATGGGALHIGGGNINPFFQDCLFLRNSGTDAGGAIMCSVGAQPQFTKCLFARNGSLLGGVIGSENASPSFESCTFANNDAVLGSVFYVYSTPIHVSYSIVAFNGTGDVSMCLGSSVQASCTDMYGNVAGDWTGCLQNQLQDPSNFSADPLFCDPDEDNYSLLVGSPCAPPGLTGCGLVGAFPQACGPISVKADSWGAIKARFR
jgi:predicted outer membrane repeat protein